MSHRLLAYDERPRFVPPHFAGKERDSESGLDNFGARYYASTMGRLMTPDPLGGRLADPQTLNKLSPPHDGFLGDALTTDKFRCASLWFLMIGLK